ncbi:MAG: hypothetical protein ACUVV0_00785 [Anaerolineae bacterium]
MKSALLGLTFFLALSVLLPAQPAWAEAPKDGGVVFGEDFTLKKGEEMSGDLVVLGGSANLESDSLLRGSLAVIGGNANVAGQVKGDAVVLGGSFRLESTALIEGDAAVFGGYFDMERGATVRGNMIEGLGKLPFPFPSPQGPEVPGPRLLPRQPTKVFIGGWRGSFFENIFGIFVRLLKAIFVSLAVTALGFLVVLFLPQQVEKTGQTILAYPWHSLGVGLLTIVVGAGVGLILMPACLVGSLVWLATFAAALFGWSAVGLLVGQRVLKILKVKEFTLPLAAMAGVLIISILTWAPCCVGFLFALAVGSLGLGAVVLTRFGTKDYPPPISFAPATTEPSPPPRPSGITEGMEGAESTEIAEEAESKKPRRTRKPKEKS